MVNIKILSGFNNYYNRQVKLPGNQLVINYSPYVIYEETGVNFVPNDGVNTQHVFGNSLNSYNGTGDYLIVVSENNEIDSRWFIIESVRDRAGQYTLTLRRDLIADYYYQIAQESTVFIEKATLSFNDPFIYNKENTMSFNQIKTNEWQLIDKSKVAWIVGYLNREYGETTGPININFTNPPPYQTFGTTLENSSIYRDRNAFYMENTRIDLYIATKAYYGNQYIRQKYTLTSTPEGSAVWSAEVLSQEEWDSKANISTNITKLTSTEVLNRLNTKSSTEKGELLNQAYNNYVSLKGSKSNYEENLDYKNKVISCTNGLYLVSVNEYVGDATFSGNYDVSSINGVATLKTYLSQLIIGTPEIKVATTQKSLLLEFTPTQQLAKPIEFTLLTRSQRAILEDAPYDMFCIPYGEIVFRQGESELKYSLPKNSALEFAQQIAENLGANLFDIQLLPYCPFIDYLENFERDGLNIIELENLVENRDYQVGSLLGTNRILMFWSKRSRGSINAQDLYYKNWNTETIESNTSEGLPASIKQLPSITNTKIANECNMFRLCSPNWNGQFEFNPAKFSNNAFNGFNVDFTYLPYSSYIHVNPIFSGLYGKDYNDARGLICQGDFSISYEGDAFVQYQINNKNYLNTFNRQIQNMEINQSAQRDMQIFNAVAGTVMGAAAGATMGSKAGGAGAAIGGIAGGVLSGIGGILDVGYGEMLRNEALDFTKDQFGYQLDNIKALPDSIAKVTAYTENNKLFPTLEYYTCTDTEKRALANKIAYNGMTVMRIGQLSEFIGNKWSYSGIESKGYIKGKLIRFPVYINELGDDYHIVNAISGELDKGVFIE